MHQDNDKVVVIDDEGAHVATMAARHQVHDQEAAEIIEDLKEQQDIQIERDENCSW